MPLHPQIQDVLRAMEKAQLRPIEAMTPPEAREQMEAVAKARNANPTPVGSIEERRIPGPGGEIGVRLYKPANPHGPLPMILYFHGGGHVIGSLDTHDAVARRFCSGAEALVASVDYRMGPEHRFPAAVEDSFAALRWLHAAADEIGGDASRIAVAGDSAGGNLATVVALLARDAGGPALRLQVLVYPVADYGLTGSSYDKYANGYGVLTREAMQWFQGHYLRDRSDADDWRASPIKAPDLSRLPPAVVITAECDVLHDEGEAYAEALRKAGVPVQYREYPGMIHAFFGMAPAVDGAVEAQAFAVDAFRKAFA